MPEPPAPEVKPPLHKSKHNPVLAPTYSTFLIGYTEGQLGKSHGNAGGRMTLPKPYVAHTIGKAPGAYAANPKAPQKALSKEFCLPKPMPFKYTDHRKPKISKAVPLCGLKSTKNYVVKNAVDAILQKPKVDNGPPDWKGATYGRVFFHKIKKNIFCKICKIEIKKHDFVSKIGEICIFLRCRITSEGSRRKSTPSKPSLSKCKKRGRQSSILAIGIFYFFGI